MDTLHPYGIFAIALLLLLATACFAAEAPTTRMFDETPEQRDARMKWWREARFGMFIHWGLYSVPAGTWQGKKIDGIGEWIMNNASIPKASWTVERSVPRSHQREDAHHPRVR